MDPGTTAVVAAAAAATGNIVIEFTKKVGGAFSEEVGYALARRYQQYRIKNATRALEEAQRQLQEIGEEPNEVPPRVLLPIIDGASLEDDPDLAAMWASLLANAARATPTTKPIFAAILGQLSPADAKILKMIDLIPRHRPRQKDTSSSAHR